MVTPTKPGLRCKVVHTQTGASESTTQVPDAAIHSYSRDQYRRRCPRRHENGGGKEHTRSATTPRPVGHAVRGGRSERNLVNQECHGRRLSVRVLPVNAATYSISQRRQPKGVCKLSYLLRLGGQKNKKSENMQVPRESPAGAPSASPVTSCSGEHCPTTGQTSHDESP